MQRTPVFGGNWKMNPADARSAHGLAAGVRRRLGSWHRSDVAVFVPGPFLPAAHDALRDSRVGLGAQDLFPAAGGAFTGGMSPPMLASVGATWALVGHSERRVVFGEDDALVAAKLRASLAAGFDTVLCVGETQAERDAGATLHVLARQLSVALNGVADLSKVVLAYEPVWAIGTGQVATPALAQQTHAAIRAVIADGHGDAAAAAIRIQYGGSVKPDNAAALLAMPDIDGALVGGASLDPDAFAAIVRAAQP